MAKRGTTLSQHVKSKGSPKTKKRLAIKREKIAEKIAKRPFKQKKK
jgi:hypothetical protein